MNEGIPFEDVAKYTGLSSTQLVHLLAIGTVVRAANSPEDLRDAVALILRKGSRETQTLSFVGAGQAYPLANVVESMILCPEIYDVPQRTCDAINVLAEFLWNEMNVEGEFVTVY